MRTLLITTLLFYLAPQIVNAQQEEDRLESQRELRLLFGAGDDDVVCNKFG
jgi:hypothetical protein